MGEATETRLEHLVHFRTGKLNSNAAVDDGQYPFFTCSPETLRIDNYAFDCEALLLAGNNAEGVFALKYYKGKFNAYQRTYVITVRDTEKLSYGYLFYNLRTQLKELQNISHGSATKFLTLTLLNDIEIPLSPLSEQKAIAEVLSSLDDKIDLLHRQNKTLESLAQTLFRQWFIEEADDSWKNGTITDLLELNPKRILSKGTVAPYLEMSNLSNSLYHPADWYDREFSSGTKFVNGDTLLARITPCLENGKTGFVDFLEEEQVGWGSTEFIVMRAKEPLHPFFSYILARHQDFRDFAIGCMVGSSGRQRADVDNLATYEIKIPSTNVINSFNAYIEPSLQKMKLINKHIRDLVRLRDSLLPKLMSGEVVCG